MVLVVFPGRSQSFGSTLRSTAGFHVLLRTSCVVPCWVAYCNPYREGCLHVGMTSSANHQWGKTKKMGPQYLGLLHCYVELYTGVPGFMMETTEHSKPYTFAGTHEHKKASDSTRAGRLPTLNPIVPLM